MTPTRFFTPVNCCQITWDDYFVLVVIALCALLGILLFRERTKHAAMVHSPPMAWLRAGIFFCLVIVFSWATGVFESVVHTPLATPAQLADPVWRLSLAGCIAVVAWSYGFWWPRGTLTHGRRLYPLPTVLYGLTWGVCVGLLYLSFYAIIEVFQWPRLINALVLVALLSVWNMNYQLGWWDIHVSPPHNRRATNTGKVLFAHQPFLVASLGFLLVYGNIGIYVLLNGAALCASAIALRFPPFWAADGGPVSPDTAMGE